MSWRLANHRDRELFVFGVERGWPLFTRQPELAVKFDGQDAARSWITKYIAPPHAELVLLRDAPGEKLPRRASHYTRRASP